METVLPESHERLDQIEQGIKTVQDKLEKDNQEATKYSGGVIQAFALMAVATDRLTIAHLRLAYFKAEYGLALPI